jgi:hypothetical protein
LFILFPGRVHWQEIGSVRKSVHDAGGVQVRRHRAVEAAETRRRGRIIAMKNLNGLLGRTVWIGTLGVAAMLVGWTPSCKAQEVSPAIFTDTGVEDAYPVAKTAAKKPVKVQVAAHADQSVTSNDANYRKQNVHRVARKPNVVSAPVV